MEKIIQKIAATSMVALAALFMTTGFASCSSDDDNEGTRKEESKEHSVSDINKFYAYYCYQFTADLLNVADVSFTYTDSLGQEQTDIVKMTVPNAEAWEYEKNIVYAKIPMTVAFKLNIKMKDKKDIPVKTVYELGWTDKPNKIVPVTADGTKVLPLVKNLSQFKYGITSAECKKVSYAELEDAFKNSKDGFENIGTTRKNIRVTTSSINVFR